MRSILPLSSRWRLPHRIIVKETSNAETLDRSRRLVHGHRGYAVAKQEGIPNVNYMAIHLGTGKCVMMTSVLNPAKYKVMGAYKTPGAASRAMRRTAECHA